MKKINILVLLTIIGGVMSFANVSAQEDTIKLEVPSNVEKVDIKYENKSASFAEKTETAIKDTANKTKANTKKLRNKTVAATKSAAKKTVNSTKNITNKTLDSTRDLIDDFNLPKDVTAAGLEKQSSIKILKNEKKALKSAYNSRIKDIKAKIKILEKSTMISDVQKRSKIYNYEQQISDLVQQRESAIMKYDARIKDIRDSER